MKVIEDYYKHLVPFLYIYLYFRILDSLFKCKN